MRGRRYQPGRRTAAALILVLWAVAILGLLAGGVAYVVRQDLAVASMEKDRLEAHWIARAGVEQAIAVLMDDYADTDTYEDYWADNEVDFKGIKIGGGSFNVIRDAYEDVPQLWYGVNDESAKLNLNAAEPEQLMELTDMTETIATAVVDWRDADQTPVEGGTEGSHYESMIHPYEIRDGMFRTARELLLVRDVTPELFYREDFNVNGLLDAEEDDGTRSDPADNADGRLDRGWYAYVTPFSYEKNVDAGGQKRININSADEGTLQSQLNLESWAAQSVVKARDNGQFEHLVDLLDVEKGQDIERDEDEEDYYERGNESNRPITQNIFIEIVDKLTLSDEEILPGRININTAPVAVLRTLPGLNDDQAEAIYRQRESSRGYTSIGQLLEISGIEKDDFASLEQQVTVRSNVFRIYSIGASGSGLARVTIECVVDRGEEVPRILYWNESRP